MSVNNRAKDGKPSEKEILNSSLKQISWWEDKTKISVKTCLENYWLRIYWAAILGWEYIFQKRKNSLLNFNEILYIIYFDENILFVQFDF